VVEKMEEIIEESSVVAEPSLAKVAQLSGGTLYLVATPIGNLEDITLRALRVLREADLLLCEDTRHTGRLLKAYDIKRPLLSLHKFNERSRQERVLAELESEKIVALVSDAGSPGISDPGSRLAAAVWDSGARVESIPGACAAIAALSVSGLRCDQFYFVGFLPVKSGQRARQLERICAFQCAIVFYESPYRIPKLLPELEQWFPSREVAICRELTKRFEEVTRGPAGEVAKALEGRKPRGEYVVIVGASSERPKKDKD
jgi:16S rRNA (cytidine1402-2'-O)-methyltransferase